MSSELYFVRDFYESDYSGVLEVWNATDMGGAHRGDNLEVIKNTINNGGALFVLTEKLSGKIIGTSWITNDKRRLYLHHFGIHPQYQGKGLSHLLMEKTMDFARKSGLQIKLEVHKENLVARKLYQKYGFNYLGDYDVFIVRKYDE
ncbi:MAG: GNAT family N-acetyltransferase [Bacteroidales bacterium]|jgi:ribosomal protein S18 acetylase RimI-like enzyme|nr:GNAT family N-acetyltransferase [Bacteroidales bacterium]HOL97448.1 GNAT family N-acetyltransferase [Bacteroidales bacterium]HOM36032.1 GNAT family N-acetyltransferase [Bacteroidales bacterium]HPD23342.1 GNAT family N-acetyltransferase [Bacteroidales bacterium]HRS99722.1 GNAT family N-acetyltransferase [Bacteroidales bacterium]